MLKGAMMYAIAKVNPNPRTGASSLLSPGGCRDLFTKLYDYPKYGTPFKRGGEVPASTEHDR